MRGAPLLLASGALVAVVSAYACGGGASSSDPLNMREPAPSSTDPAPPGSEPASSSYEAPPSSTDPAPVTGDPANQSGGGACIPCSGTYSCTVSGSSDAVTISLGMNDGACSLKGIDMIPGITSCGGGAATFTEQGVTVTVKREGAGFSACVAVDGGTYCATCTPSAGSVTAGQDAGSGGLKPSAGGCSSLAGCCGSLSSVEATECNETVSLGNADSCSALLSSFMASGGCD